MNLIALLKNMVHSPAISRQDSWADINEAMDDTSKIRDLGLNMVLSLNRNLLVALATKGTPCRYAKGDIIFRQGDVGDAFYLVKKGAVHATVQTASGAPDLVVKSIIEGQYFGEFALLNDTHSRRSATITASLDTEVVRMSKYDFSSLIEQNQHLHQKLWNKMRETLKTEDAVFSSHDPEGLTSEAHATLQAFGLELYKLIESGELEVTSARLLFKAFEKALRAAANDEADST